jgi:hypothetical protein
MQHDELDPIREGETEAEWTPGRGLLRALAWGGMACAVLLLLLDVLAWFAPLIVSNWWLRAAISFLVAVLLFAVVHRAAGMAGAACTGLVIGFCIVILLSQHFVFDVHGVLTARAVRVGGKIWLNPPVLFTVNVPALIGIALSVAFCHGGGTIARSISEILMSKAG